MTDYQPDEIEDKFGVIRRCGSMPSKHPPAMVMVDKDRFLLDVVPVPKSTAAR